MTEDEAQATHEQRRATDPDHHDTISCWCCCWDCDDLAELVEP